METKNTFKSPQVEETYHMTKLMNLLDSHHKAFMQILQGKGFGKPTTSV